jgi:hypothetical protein
MCFVPCQPSYGVMPSKLLVADLLRTKTAVSVAYPQNSAGTLMVFSMHRVVPMTVWFLCSTTPFCCGE